MTIVASADLVPELQHWFYLFVVNSVVNKFEVPAPVDIDAIWMPNSSFIEMLFNENYSDDKYFYLYDIEESLGSWPELTRQRLCIYPGAATYYALSETAGEGDNIFMLQSADLILLDALLAYRTDGTAVTIADIDATASLIFDSTSLILYANFNSLPTELSKLIYLYLDLKLRSRYDNYNNLNTVSTSEPLETMYELLLIDEYFQSMSARNVDVSLQC